MINAAEKSGRSTTGAVAVVGVPVADEKGWAERRDAHDRVATVDWRNRAIIDRGYDPGVNERQ
ncbi:MAG: hypothetical protein ACREAB_03960 [Blastocatellia bacterium]